MLQHPLFLAVCALWFASELLIDRRRSVDGASRRDAGTLRLLHATIALSVAAGVWLSMRGAWRFPPTLLPWLPWAGLALMAAGLAFRAWSIRVLAQQFTVDVSVRPDHELVRRGPTACCATPPTPARSRPSSASRWRWARGRRCWW